MHLRVLIRGTSMLNVVKKVHWEPRAIVVELNHEKLQAVVLRDAHCDGYLNMVEVVRAVTHGVSQALWKGLGVKVGVLCVEAFKTLTDRNVVGNTLSSIIHDHLTEHLSYVHNVQILRRGHHRTTCCIKTAQHRSNLVQTFFIGAITILKHSANLI
ncbi:hypothetical protein DQ04_10361010 [Trypanosoma grayi]|uniref:hypothetical protein n=1 Tax=Trypanosoma grayi TaxID=71804 RepID=UPI0004F452F9|nr:hypothetical protein DQ04_10361010 [Trypanosoma grayi]KEG07268.1 hypothetical protein DQ04_10361010 [Trypanosoma grayi]